MSKCSRSAGTAPCAARRRAPAARPPPGPSARASGEDPREAVRCSGAYSFIAAPGGEALRPSSCGATTGSTRSPPRSRTTRATEFFRAGGGRRRVLIPLALRHRVLVPPHLRGALPARPEEDGRVRRPRLRLQLRRHPEVRREDRRPGLDRPAPRPALPGSRTTPTAGRLAAEVDPVRGRARCTSPHHRDSPYVPSSPHSPEAGMAKIYRSQRSARRAPRRSPRSARARATGSGRIATAPR